VNEAYRTQAPVPATPPVVVPLRTKRVLHFTIALVISPMVILFLLGFIGALFKPSAILVPFGLGTLLGIVGIGLSVRSGLKVPTRALVWPGNGRVTITCGDHRVDVALAHVRDVRVSPRGWEGHRPRIPLQTIVVVDANGQELDLLPKIAAMPHDLAPARDALARIFAGGR
jgi:hypothetical protein